MAQSVGILLGIPLQTGHHPVSHMLILGTSELSGPLSSLFNQTLEGLLIYCLTVSFTKTCHEKSQGPWHTIRQVRNHVASSTLHLWLWRWVVLDDHLKTPELRYMATGDSPGMPWLWISEKMLCKYD